MKPTLEQVRAEAKHRWHDEMCIGAFIEGATWALSQDSTIEKVKELIEKMINTETYSINRREVIEQLNAIIK